MDDITIGVIGGTGLYNLDNLNIIDEREITTPFGRPSDKYIIGEIHNVKVAFLSRHARGHKILPTEINCRANIYAFKKLGVKTLISVSAVGSLREEIEPSHLVFPNQLFDRTKTRVSTFFGEGIVAHIGFADPFCANLISLFEKCARELRILYHRDKTYVCMEGPQFSTKAESKYYRLIGGDVIGMTALPEAKLAREAEMCFGSIALSTDYDCWRENEKPVTVDEVVETMHKNINSAKQLLKVVIPQIKEEQCSCHDSLKNSFMTDRNAWPEAAINKLDLIIKKYL